MQHQAQASGVDGVNGASGASSVATTANASPIDRLSQDSKTDTTDSNNNNPPSPPPQHNAHLYSFWVALCFLINYMIGVGVLELPYVFYKGGIAYASVMVLFSAALMSFATVWIVEGIARTVGWAAVAYSKEAEEAIQSAQAEADRARSIADPEAERLIAAQAASSSSDDTHVDTATAVQRLQRFFDLPAETVRRVIRDYHANRSAHSSDQPTRSDSAILQVSFDPQEESCKHVIVHDMENRYFEINELMDVFSPLWATIIYEIMLYMVMLMSLWSYTAVFGTSFTNKFPIFAWGTTCDSDKYTVNCAWTFRFFVLIFAVVVIWTSMYDVTELKIFQIILTAARFLLLLIVLLTCAIGLYYNPKESGSSSPSSSPPYYSPFALWNWSATMTMLAAIIFAQQMTQGVPSVLSPMKQRNRLGATITVSMTVTNIMYIAIGIAASLFFGPKLKTQINLNYQSYTGGAEPTQWWAYFVQYFVSLFPGIDVISVSPLYAITTGNTLRGMMMRWSKSVRRFDKRSRWFIYLTRLFATIPPITLALFEWNLGRIIQYSFIPGFWIAFIAPSCLQFYSIQKCKKFGVDWRTPFSTVVHSGYVTMLFIMAFAVACYVGVIYTMATGTAFAV